MSKLLVCDKCVRPYIGKVCPYCWKKVKFAADCPPCDYCGEPVCEDCDEHYSECQCVGPAQLDDYDIKEIDGELYYYVRPTV